MITDTELCKIAMLARLSCSDKEIANFAKQLTTIMDMIDILNEVDCDNVEPLSSVSDMNQRMRKDDVIAKDISDELFANIPGGIQLAKEVKCFIVPKVVE